mgnify:FL=1
MSWEAVLVLLVIALGLARVADVVNDLIGSYVPNKIAGTGLSGDRLILWVVVAVLGILLNNAVGFEPLALIGIDGSVIWNTIALMSIADATDKFYRSRLLR